MPRFSVFGSKEGLFGQEQEWMKLTGPAFADLPVPAETGASRRRERLPPARLLEAALRAGRHRAGLPGIEE